MSSETIESTRGIEFLAWLEINKKRLIAAALVGALLLGGFALYRWRSAQLEIEANSGLVLLQSGRTQAGLPAAEVKAEELLEFASRYRSTQAGKRGLLLAAGALFREGNTRKASTVSSPFVRQPRQSVGGHGHPGRGRVFRGHGQNRRSHRGLP